MEYFIQKLADPEIIAAMIFAFLFGVLVTTACVVVPPVWKLPEDKEPEEMEL